MNIDQNEFNRIFQEAKTRYKELEHANIKLTFNRSWFFTMRASVKITSLFNEKRKYIVNVNPKKARLISKLSKEDITGWFGHELSHIVDYETMSRSEFLLFVLRYVFDIKYRFFVERRVNTFAYNNGFAKELFGVWRKFLAMDGVSKKYKNYILKNYPPRWEDVKNVATEEGFTKETYEALI